VGDTGPGEGDITFPDIGLLESRTGTGFP
jgi:hypothetical protein